MASSNAHIHGLDTQGVVKIKEKLEDYRTTLQKGIDAFLGLTSRTWNGENYFGTSTALKNFVAKTNLVYNKLVPAGNKLGEYIDQFDKVEKNYKQFADSSAAAVSTNMKS